MTREPNTVYVLSLSYGKDSLACLDAIQRLGLPLDRIVHSEVWFDDDTPADLPPMVEFKSKADKIILERYGIKVDHICAVKKEGRVYGKFAGGDSDSLTENCSITSSQTANTENQSKVSRSQKVDGADTSNTKKLTYLDLFYKVIQPRKKIGGRTSSRIPNTEGKLVYKLPQVHREGKIYGFPYIVPGGWCHQLKTESMASQYQYIKKIGVRDSKFSDASSRTKEDVKIKIVQYLGIAADEPKRIEKHASRPNVMLPLVMANMTEADCRKWCEENDLLSPIYTTATRGGCWFCHNQGIGQLRQLRHNYPNLWKKLLDIDLDSPTTFHADGRTVHDFERRFQAEDDGYISADDRFRWDMLDNMQVTFDVIGKEKQK